MKNRISTLFKNKIINGSRYFYVRYLPGLFDFFLVTEYPKSGGTWLGQLLSGYFEIPFPRNKFPTLNLSVVHGHFLPSMFSGKVKKTIHLCRDGRDVMVSSYYHNLIWNERNIKAPKDVLYYRKKLGFKDPADIRTNLPSYLEFLFKHKPSAIIRFGFEGNWASFNREWNSYITNEGNNNIISTSYEALKKDTQKELWRLIYEIKGVEPDPLKIEEVVERYSFKNQAKRAPGVENKSSFLRKGVVGDWTNHFSKKAVEIFDHYAGDTLIDLGYEKNREWINNIK